MSQEVSDFEDIRPYRDDEITAVVARLVDDREFIDTLARMKFTRLAQWLPWLLRPLIRRALSRQFGHLNSIRQCQALFSGQLAQLLERVANGVTVSGLDKLAADRTYLFISNHRDIAMDAAMVNLALHKQGMDTARNAIGDNLLSKPFTSDLMRLNKSFIVKRSATGRREKLAALKNLSAYISHSLSVDKQSVWIAQAEGRAKDGVDTTETALLKMLVLNKPENESFGEAFARLHVVPISVSYEWDPCDGGKAGELYAVENEGGYKKAEHEDINSIYRGIMGQKGRIDVAFGEELTEPFADADAAAAAIDRQIIDNYRLQTSHLMAHEELYGASALTSQWREAMAGVDWQAVRGALLERLSKVPKQHRNIMLAAYANPVQRRLDLLNAQQRT